MGEPKPSSFTHSSKVSWFTPKKLLVILCVINFINYLDRGLIGSNGINGSSKTCSSDGKCQAGTGIQGDFNLTNFEDGVLSSAFMVGLLVASPIFASLAKTFNPFRLIGVGLTIWTIATSGCGVSVNFWTIAICRMLVGVGEASFISLAAPFIDDSAPFNKRTSWLAAFYMCIPTGVAVGYLYGGWVGVQFGWRYAFFGESILMVPFAILGFFMKPLKLKGFSSSEAESGQILTPGENYIPDVEDGHASLEDTQVLKGKVTAFVGHEGCSQDTPESSKEKPKPLNSFSRFWKDIKALVDKVYVVNVLGYILYNFVIGAYVYWGPKVGYAIYHMSSPDMVFGGITSVCGIFGTLAGGYILDRMNSTIRNAFKLLSGTTLLGAVFCFGAFCLRNVYGFIALFSVGELLVFATQAPVNFVCLRCVEPGLRPLSLALCTVLIHICGDVPSSPLVGLLQDRIKNWREVALILTSVFFLAAAVWFLGIFLHSVDKFSEDNEEQVPPDGSIEESTMPKPVGP